MTRYLLSIYQPDGPPPPAEALEPVMRDMRQLIADARGAGAWVFNGGLHDAGTATVVRMRDGEPTLTDGPYVESKEHIGGLMVIDAPDLDAALVWARRMAAALTLRGPGAPSTGLGVEVRPFQDGHGHA